MDFALLNRKLSGGWSAGTVSKSLATVQAMRELHRCFDDKLTKKDQMSILVALLGLEQKEVISLSTEIDDLLTAASDDRRHDKVSYSEICTQPSFNFD
jgi:hypothetical protein